MNPLGAILFLTSSMAVPTILEAKSFTADSTCDVTMSVAAFSREFLGFEDLGIWLVSS